MLSRKYLPERCCRLTPACKLVKEIQRQRKGLHYKGDRLILYALIILDTEDMGS